ncbi:MAG: hypothetical protein H7Z21_06115, partial [Hymenobacter sp.]|nr:hypothetical protein [Hymenobacter sp.]
MPGVACLFENIIRMIKKIALAAAVLGIIIYSLTDLQPDISAYAAPLNKARKEKNRSFRLAQDSPLPATQKAQFDSLKYYPTALDFVVVAAITRNARPDTTLLQMSDNRTEKYLNWGQAKFTVD